MNDIAPTRFKWVGTRPIRPDGVPKVTGRAMYGADFATAGTLYGKIIRSPHAHARIRSIDTSKAEALPGVKAVVTAKDFPDHKFEYIGPERVAQNFWHMTRNVMAREKALYEGHAGRRGRGDQQIGRRGSRLADRDRLRGAAARHRRRRGDEARRAAAVRGHDHARHRAGADQAVERLEAARIQDRRPDAGFAEADEIVEKEFKTAAVHQGYIEPHACVARVDADGQAEIWASSQGHFVVRALTAKLLDMPVGDVRVTPAEIGGGFGGKTVVYLEPVAALLAKKSGRPVKITMSRDEVFKATGPTSGSSMRVKIGVKKDGTITAADGVFKFQAGAFPGSPVMNACLCAFAPYNIANEHTVGYDVVCNRPKSAAYRAPGSPISAFAVESVLDMLAKKIGMDPLQLRLKNAARPGTPMIYGPKLGHGGYVETVEAWSTIRPTRRRSARTRGAASPRAIGSTAAASSSATVQVNEDGTVIVATGSVDIGGSRASMALMAAETLGVDYNQVRSIVADTSSVGYTHVTGGSRVTFATGMAVVDASKKVVDELRARAAMIWDVDVEGVVWEDGHAKPASSNVGDFAPMSLKEIAAKTALTGGPITAAASVNAGGRRPASRRSSAMSRSIPRPAR